MNLLFQVLIATCVLLAVAAQSGNLLTSCVPSGTFNSAKDYFPNKVAPTASKFWDIKYFKTYKILRNEIAGESFVLYQCGTTPPASEANKGHTHFIPVPLRNGIALSSTTLIPYIELLGRRLSIKAWLGSPDYISSACLKKLIASGSTTVVKDTSKPANVNALKTTFGNNIVSFHNYRDGYRSSLLNVTDSSYLEATNEAIFEWIKFFAAFYNEEKKANTLVFSSQQRYRCYAKVSSDIVDASDGGVKPKLLWASYTNFNGVDGWDVAECPNYFCEYANLCSADLINSRAGTIDYYGTKLFTTEAFVALAKNAPHWIYSSNNWDEAYGKYKTQLDNFVSVKQKQVFDTTGSGDDAWFENRLAEYDVVLNDICAVVGTANPLHKRKFLRNVFKESAGQAATTCPSTSAPLVTRATPCRKYNVPTGGVCFSGENTVELEGGMSIHMKDLRIGDVVEAGEGRFSRVYSFGHFNADLQSTFLQLYTSNSPTNPIEISPDHMIFVGKEAVPAGSVKVGDLLRLGNGEPTEIVQIKSVIRAGAYAPFTHSGAIVVNGIVASNYVSFESHSGDMIVGGLKVASYQWVAHLAQSPHRIYCTLAASNCEKETYNDCGISLWVATPLRAARWWHTQNAAVRGMIIAPLLLVLLCIYAAELLLKYPWMMAFIIAIAFHKKLVRTKPC